jgi:uncharacterized protein (TIGR03435 family)
VASDVVIGLPRSADSQYWDILGKMPSSGEGAFNTMRGHLTAPPLSVALEMLRGVLLDQFEMKTHTETREVTVCPDRGERKTEDDEGRRLRAGRLPERPQRVSSVHEYVADGRL